MQVIQIQFKLDNVKEQLEKEKLETWKQECTQIAIESVKTSMRKQLIQDCLKRMSKFIHFKIKFS